MKHLKIENKNEFVHVNINQRNKKINIKKVTIKIIMNQNKRKIAKGKIFHIKEFQKSSKFQFCRA